MMHFFLGALLFLLATAALAYVPGALLLLLLKRSLSSAEYITLSCVIGLVVSAGVYWLFGFVHLFRLYFLWPLLATAVFASLLWSRRRPPGVAWKQNRFSTKALSHITTIARGLS